MEYKTRIPENFQRYNANLLAWEDITRLDINKLTDSIIAAGCGNIRVPGGDPGNFWNWNEGGVVGDAKADQNGDGRRYPPGYDRTPEPLPFHLRWQVHKTSFTLENIDPLFTLTGADGTWVVNINSGGGGGESALDKEVRHLKKAESLGLPVDVIEIGNELYFGIPNYRWSGADGQEPLESADDYARVCKRWSQRMRSEFPNAEIYAIGTIPEKHEDPRAIDWPNALDRENTWDAIDGITIHPYHSINEASNAQLSDVGDNKRAEEIALASLNKLRDTMSKPSLSRIPDRKKILITEHGVIEDANNPKTGRVVWGNTWASALCLDIHNMIFLKDERIEGSYLHVLSGNPQWEAIHNEQGLAIDPAKRGRENAPYTGGIAEPLSLTLHGYVLGLSDGIWDGGQGELIADQPGFMAWAVAQGEARFINATNVYGSERTLIVPDDFVGVARVYSADPWLTEPQESKYPEPETKRLEPGDTLTIPAWSKVVCLGAVAGDEPIEPTTPVDPPVDAPPVDETEVKKLRRRVRRLETQTARIYKLLSQLAGGIEDVIE